MTAVHSSNQQAFQPQVIINSLLIKAMEAPNRQALQFIITNDTHKLIPYDRAILWEMGEKKVNLIGISGQSVVNPFTEIYKQLSGLPNYLIDPQSVQFLSSDSFKEGKDQWAQYQRNQVASIIWLPIFSQGKLCLGLWLEKWNVSKEEFTAKDTLHLLSQHLLPGYGAMWEKFSIKTHLKTIARSKKRFWIPALAALALALVVIRIPLRVVAPCEIVPKDPFIVTAPLQGIIKLIDVKPGSEVHKGDLLFEYDKRLQTQELKVAQNEVEITEAALNRALALGLHDQASLNDVAILKLKLEKEKIGLDLAQHNYDLLDAHSPMNGAAIIDDPDQWPGRPVNIGEKVMTIVDLAQTKIKIWVPENDNIDIDLTEPIKVYLNVSPEKQWIAKLNYISSTVTMSDADIPSFIAEANWNNPKNSPKPGLKGTAVLYGPRVSLLYYIMRKPWILLRHAFGL